ncbi:MAG TPA: carboxymuconolactone decarboxylase family protein [Aggregicoccus sp.]|nr:carboxymuconolactone decarboxylase family protein [Aggregicoccus sp.]
MNEKTYPELYDHLRRLMGTLAKEASGPLGAFTQLHHKSLAEGALSTKHKELQCLAIGMAVHCEGCIAYHVHDALKAGASREEVVETIAVALMMGGGPGSVYAAMAMEALEQFQEAGAASTK